MARMEEQLRPFSVEPGVALRLSQAELARITEAGRQEPYRKWGQEWPYWVSRSQLAWAICARSTQLHKGGQG